MLKKTDSKSDSRKGTPDPRCSTPKPSKKASKKAVVHESDSEEDIADEGLDIISDGERSDGDEEGGGNEKKRKERKEALIIDEPTEDKLVEWVQSHPELYDKSKADYRKTAAKKALWQKKADELNYNVEDLICWYKSQRTRLGKILTRKSGQAAKILTSRENWVLEKWSFLTKFITRQHGRLPSSVSTIQFIMALKSLPMITFCKMLINVFLNMHPCEENCARQMSLKFGTKMSVTFYKMKHTTCF